MNFNKLSMLAGMSVDRNVVKALFNINSILKEDKNFNMFKYVKLMTNMIKGEKIIKFEDRYVISAFLPPFPSRAFNTNITAVCKKENIYTQQIYAKRSAPISMYLCLTNKCPNNCTYCSAKNRVDEEELSTREWIGIIKELQNMGTPIIGLTGGEPMVREDIYDIIRGIDDRSNSTLFTSGFNLSLERAKELKESGLFSIGISLDSYDKNKHNSNRNSEAAFEYAVNAIQNARRAGLYTMAQTVILKNEIDEASLFKLFRLAKDNGAHEVKILEPILSGKLLDEKNLNNILYTDQDRKKLISIQHKANRQSNFPKITSFAYTESEEKFGCGAGTQHSYISASGHLFPCDFVPMDFGSFKEKPIGELWLEMNKEIGIPKIGCMAQKVNGEVYKRAEGKLPLCKEESIGICQKCISKKYPKYYSSVQ